jgi:uncharacterized membrane protein
VNPFDLKSMLMEKHAQHVVLIHFPIALFITGVALDFAAHWTNRQTLAVAARINLLLAAVAALPTLVTGLIAWQWALEGQKLKGSLLWHLLFALAATVLIWFAAWIHVRARDGVLPWWRFAVELTGVALLGVAGHLGGFLSGVNV